MFPVIDYRNGRYQGQIKNQSPHGLGIFIDKNFMFCLAEWMGGEIKGYAMIIFPSGRIFCGKLLQRKPEQLANFQQNEDHVQLMTYFIPRRQPSSQKIAAIMPLLNNIIQIDNSNLNIARVLQEYPYSARSQQDNISTISKILNLQQNKQTQKYIATHKNCIQFFQDIFYRNYSQIIQLLITDSKGKTQYFIGLKGEGLGIKIEPIQAQLSLLDKNKSIQKSYIIRSIGHFTKENQLKDIGFKTINNYMKGFIFQEGIYSNPSTIIKYQAKKRPIQCCINIHNYLKRSLAYRDKVLNTLYMYELQIFVQSFNQNLRKIQTQKIAQNTIQNPSANLQYLSYLQSKRKQPEKSHQSYLMSKQIQHNQPNPYNHSPNIKVKSDYNLHKAKEDIYRSKEKKKGLSRQQLENYRDVSFTDGKYRDYLDEQENRGVPYSRPFDNYTERHPVTKFTSPSYNKPQRTSPFKYLAQQEQPPRLKDRSLSPKIDNYQKSPYKYLQTYTNSYNPLHVPSYSSNSLYNPAYNTRQIKNNNYIASSNNLQRYNSPVQQFQSQSNQHHNKILKNPYLNRNNTRQQSNFVYNKERRYDNNNYDTPSSSIPLPHTIQPTIKDNYKHTIQPTNRDNYKQDIYNSKSNRPHYNYHFKNNYQNQRRQIDRSNSPSKQTYKHDKYLY